MRSPLRLSFLAAAVLLAGCETSSSNQPQHKLNPTPEQAYEVRLLIEEAPGPFAQVKASVQYNALNGATCGKASRLAGNVPNPSVMEDVSFERVSDTEYRGVVYNDLLVDEDYFGNGVCNWALTHVSVGVTGDTSDYGSWYVATLSNDALQTGRPRVRYYSRAPYPTAQVTGYSVPEHETLQGIPESQRGEFFKMTLVGQAEVHD